MNKEQPIKAIIVEDDPQHSSALRELLKDASFPIEVLDTCSNVADAFSRIVKFRPDLVFLDIELEMGDNSFDLLKKFDHVDFAVIFTTQFRTADNAINALRACALDFLSKPVAISELNTALEKFNKALGVDRVNTFVSNMSDSEKKAIWIAAPNGYVRIEQSNIMYCKSHNVYTHFFLAAPVEGKEVYVSSNSIKNWEKHFAGSSIHRIHNRHLVNFACVYKYISRLDGSSFLKLTSGTLVPISRLKKKEIKTLLDLYRKSS